MKQHQAVVLVPVILAGTLLFGSGCSSPDVQRAKHLVEVDALPGAGNRGYVEFYTLSTNFPVPIFLVDDQQRPILLAGVGLKAGEKYSYPRHQSLVAEKLRVAMPAGTHQFIIGRDGRRLNVSVLEGKVTPVELDYKVLDRASTELVYRLNSRVFSPGSLPEEQGGGPSR